MAKNFRAKRQVFSKYFSEFRLNLALDWVKGLNYLNSFKQIIVSQKSPYFYKNNKFRLELQAMAMLHSHWHRHHLHTRPRILMCMAGVSEDTTLGIKLQMQAAAIVIVEGED